MQITPYVYNVGADGNNAYLITGEKTALIDTVSKELSGEMLAAIEKIMSVRDIDYLICNHTEQDKTGAVEDIIKKNPDIEIIATVAGLRNLREMLNREINGRVAKDNALLELGNGLRLKFIITPNINWPDSMVTYEEQSKILFSCDFLCDNSERESAYPEFMLTAIDRTAALQIDKVCAGKGAVSDNPKALIEKYRTQYENYNTSGIVIVYSSRYGATEKMAKVIKSALKGKEVYMLDADKDNAQDIAARINSAVALIAGTQTEDRRSGKPLLDVITSLNPVRMRHKPFFTFGSYGWSGEGAQIVHNILESYGMKPFSKPFMSIFNLSDERKAELIKHTQKFEENIYAEN